MTGDVLSFVKTAAPVDLAFVAPPYVFDEWAPIFESLKTGLMVCESDRHLDVPDQWTPVRVKNYGQTVITMLEPT